MLPLLTTHVPGGIRWGGSSCKRPPIPTRKRLSKSHPPSIHRIALSATPCSFPCAAGIAVLGALSLFVSPVTPVKTVVRRAANNHSFKHLGASGWRKPADFDFNQPAYAGRSPFR